MRNLRKLTSSDLKLGEPLRFSVYDHNGVLLMRQGIVVTIPAQAQRLLTGGIYQDLDEAPHRPDAPPPPPEAHERPPVFLSAEQICNRVKNLYAGILRLPDQADAMAKGLEIADLIQAACAEDADALVAALHLDLASAYLLVHQSLGGVLAELTGREAGFERAARRGLIAAAVTRDIAQTAIQGELDRHQGPLTPELRAKVEAHPLHGSQLLAVAGVTDKDWLDAVAGHHERLDGSGYPFRLSAADIGPGARLLAVCDVYSAMIKPRPYRAQGRAAFTQSALREIYNASGNTLDNAYAAPLIKAIGVLPAGSLVRLQCGEIAVVKNASSNPAAMTVHSIYGKNQMPLINPVPRRTDEAGFAITGMAHYTECRSAQLTIRRLWLKGN